MQSLLDNSVLIDIHSDYKRGTAKENLQLKQTYVLISALKDGNDTIPVQFEIKQYVDNNKRLYLAVALTKIKTGVVDDTMNDINQTSTRLLPVSSFIILHFWSIINLKKGPKLLPGPSSNQKGYKKSR